MSVRTDPFRQLDRLTQQMFGADGTPARPPVMPMDAWRDGDTLTVEFNLPEVSPDAINLDVERNVVTVKAERPARASDTGLLAGERPRGVFSRQLVLGDNLDTERIEASYDAGVLTLYIPVAHAHPQRPTLHHPTRAPWVHPNMGPILPALPCRCGPGVPRGRDHTFDARLITVS